MHYLVKFDDTFLTDIEEIRSLLSEKSTKAFSRFIKHFRSNISLIKANPRLYKIFEPLPPYRRMNLDYDYAAFYTIDDETKLITFRTMLYGPRDLERTLGMRPDE